MSCKHLFANHALPDAENGSATGVLLHGRRSGKVSPLQALPRDNAMREAKCQFEPIADHEKLYGSETTSEPGSRFGSMETNWTPVTKSGIDQLVDSCACSLIPKTGYQPPYLQTITFQPILKWLRTRSEVSRNVGVKKRGAGLQQ